MKKHTLVSAILVGDVSGRMLFEPLADIFTDGLGEGFAPNIREVHDLDKPFSSEFLECWQLGIIKGNDGLVIEDTREPLLDRLQSSEVDNPLVFIQFNRLEDQFDFKSVPVNEATMRLRSPLPKGA